MAPLLESLAATIDRDQCVIWILDNASDDETVAAIEREQKRLDLSLRLLPGTENIGYIRGVNRAFAALRRGNAVRHGRAAEPGHRGPSRLVAAARRRAERPEGRLGLLAPPAARWHDQQPRQRAPLPWPRLRAGLRRAGFRPAGEARTFFRQRRGPGLSRGNARRHERPVRPVGRFVGGAILLCGRHRLWLASAPGWIR